MGPLTEAERAEERTALLALLEVPRWGPARVRRAVEAWGTARAALERMPAGTVSPAALDAARRGVDVALRTGMEVVLWTDPGYPASLRALPDPPPVLFLRGARRDLLGVRGIAVVGARRATARARTVARRLGRAAAGRGVPVVSGLALGVDGAAHLGALDVGGPTVAVLGCGADRAYPARHRRIFERIVADGLAVSEFLPGTPPRAWNFPRRNRILAALSVRVVVVEAGARSGALITADHALDLGIDVLAVPGPVDVEACRGSNLLLRDGARPVLSVADFVEGVVEPVARSGVAGPGADPDGTDARPRPLPAGRLERALLETLDAGPGSVEDMARAARAAPRQVLAALVRLELDGHVERAAGACYRRCA